jgi:capsid protein
MNTQADKLKRAREQLELVRTQLTTEILKRRLASVKNEYDVLKPNKLRRQPIVERKSETEIYNITKRLRGANLGRDLERNYSPARGLLHQFRVNVVGTEGKIRVNTGDDAGKKAAEWFNSVWAKSVDYRDERLHWCDWLTNVLISVIREGDVLIVVDDSVVEDSGKLLTWETDQITTLAESEFQKTQFGKTGCVQDSGIIRNKYGKIVAYIATSKRGLYEATLDDVTIFSVDVARLIYSPWRLNQGRGVPDLLTPASNFVDLYEILARELQSAKRAAAQYAYVKREHAVTDWDNPGAGAEFLPENAGKTAGEVEAEGANETVATGAKNYERLEEFTGGYTDYLDPGDVVEIPDIKRPNVNLAEFLQAVHAFSGAALGVASAYTKLRADSSYTAFRGDMVMTWMTFKWWQKKMERMVCDWVAKKVLKWAMRKKEIDELTPGWEQKISWVWPRMPEVDQLAIQNAYTAALKNATADYAELIGPDWEEKMEGLAKQIEKARQLKLPLKIFETQAGVPL